MRSTPVDSFDGGPPLTSYSIRISFGSLDLVRRRLLYTYDFMIFSLLDVRCATNCYDFI